MFQGILLGLLWRYSGIASVPSRAGRPDRQLLLRRETGEPLRTQNVEAFRLWIFLLARLAPKLSFGCSIIDSKTLRLGLDDRRTAREFLDGLTGDARECKAPTGFLNPVSKIAKLAREAGVE